jgi:hypothetical protein
MRSAVGDPMGICNGSRRLESRAHKNRVERNTQQLHELEFWDPFDWIGLTGRHPASPSIRGWGKTILSASAQNVVSWWQFWAYGSTQKLGVQWMWTDKYLLTGNPGQYAAITLITIFLQQDQLRVRRRSMTNTNVWMLYAIDRTRMFLIMTASCQTLIIKPFMLWRCRDDGHLIGSVPFGTLGPMIIFQF